MVIHVGVLHRSGKITLIQSLLPESII